MLGWPHQWCDDGEVSDPMAALDAAYAEIQRAEQLADNIVNGAWLDFGRMIRQMRADGTKQADIARHFKWEPEHVRRIQEDADVADGIKAPPARKTRPVATVTLRDLERAGFRVDLSADPSPGPAES